MPVGTVSHYRIIEFLGGGAVGKVYLAEDTLLHRQVALKFLSPDLTDNEETSRRFMIEARTASSLDHRNICTIHEIAPTEDGSWFIAMSYCEGTTLRERLGSGRLAPEQALKLARQIAAGLAAAHEKGIVHRDIKPDNVMVTDQDEVKILDFGLARLVGHARQTISGTVMGTANYMSPEQGRGDDVGPASDVWSLGVVLHEMLTGETPFRGENEMAVIYSVLNHDPPPLPAGEYPSAGTCARILKRCLDKNPDRRYSSARILADDLKVALEEERSTGQSGSARKSRSTHGSIYFRPRRQRWFMLGTALVALLALASVGFPEQRGALLEFFKFGRGPSSVAVLPFVLVGDDEGAEALGAGLAMVVSDRLAELENSGGDLWVIPQADIQGNLVRDRDLAARRLAADFVITGGGSFDGKTIVLEVALFDPKTGVEKVREFRDSYGNLKTWQADLVGWLARRIDPDLPPTLPDGVGTGTTAVPAAFLAYNRGRGYLTMAQGDPGRRDDLVSRATGAFAEAVAADSSFAGAWAGLGEGWTALPAPAGKDQYQAALEPLAQAVLLSPGLVTVQLNLAKIHQARGDSAAALEHAQRALDLDPGYLPSLYALGSVNSQFGNHEAAAAFYRLAADERPDYPSGHRIAGFYHYYRSELDRTEKYWREVVKLTPDDNYGYNLLGAVLFNQERWTEAGEQFRQSIAIKPSRDGYNNLGTISYYDGRYPDAIDYYRHSVALQLEAGDGQGVHYPTYQHMAEAFRWAPGFEDSARVYYARALKGLEQDLAGEPGDQGLLVDKASFAINLGRPDEAREIMAQLATRTDLLAHTMFTMATVLEELGDRDAAFTMLEKALAAGLSPKLVAVYPILRNLRSTNRYQLMRAAYVRK